MNDNIRIILDEALESERKDNGKRFSTHYEAQARIKSQFDNAMKCIQEVARSVDALWYMTRTETFDQAYIDQCGQLKEATLYAAYNLLGQYALLEKLEAGVVHTPKQDTEVT